MRAAAGDRVEEGARRVEAEQGVDVPQVFAKEMVEEAVEAAGMVVAIPPEPVGALGDIDFVPGSLEGGCVVAERSFFGCEEGPCGVQRVPGLIVFGVADPDGEVVADPASGEEAWECVVRAGVLQGSEPTFTGRMWAASGDAMVEGAEKRDAAVGVVLPAVFAVQDDGDEGGGVMAAGVADGVELGHEVAGGSGAGASLVVKADLVGHGVVAEDDGELVVRLADFPGAIEQLGMADVAAAIAADLAAGRTSQNFFIGRDPLQPRLGEQGDDRLGDGTFAGPHAGGAFAEVVNMGVDRAP